MRFYRSFTLLFFILSHILAAGIWLAGHGHSAFVLATLANAMVWIPTLVPNHSWFGRCVTRFATGKPEIWITIDDGPDPSDTPVLLDLLDAHGARATFFLVGERAASQPDLVRAIRDRGHGVANHSQRHLRAWFWVLVGPILKREIKKASASLESVTGSVPRLFRPPVGMKNPLVQPILDAEGLTHIGWSIRGLDGVSAHPERVLQRLRPGLEPGAIILIHQGNRTAAGQPLAPLVLHLLLQELAGRELRAVIPPADSFLPKGAEKRSGSC